MKNNQLNLAPRAAVPAKMQDKQNERDHRELRIDKVGVRGFDTFVKCFERGLLVRQTGDIIALAPPLIVERAQIDQMFATLSEVLRTH